MRYGVSPYRLSPLVAVRHYRGPVLVVGGMADRSTTPAETRRLYLAVPGPRALLLLEGVDHAGAGSVWNADYRRRVRAFFARNLGEPGAADAGPVGIAGPT
ncbi:MAG: hypothetical protein ACXWUR_02040 [Allosphingosinicella sp.]